jgi:hypothetical protein
MALAETTCPPVVVVVPLKLGHYKDVVYRQIQEVKSLRLVCSEIRQLKATAGLVFVGTPACISRVTVQGMAGSLLHQSGRSWLG